MNLRPFNPMKSLAFLLFIGSTACYAASNNEDKTLMSCHSKDTLKVVQCPKDSKASYNGKPCGRCAQKQDGEICCTDLLG